MKRFGFTLCAVFFFTTAFMQNTIPKAQTLFIFDFSKLVEWPVNCRDGSFVIGVLGDSDIFNELKSHAQGKKVGDQSIIVSQFNSPNDITNCHILFVPFSKTRLIPEINQHLTEKSTLLVTEKNGALNEGSAINFVIFQQKMKFEVKTDNANKYGILISPELKEMAMQVM